VEIDAELDVWRRQWQSDAAVPLELRSVVARQSRFMKIVLLADVLVTVTIGGGVILWAMRSSQRDVVLLAVVTWLFLAAAWTASLRFNRGNWSPSALDTAAFIDLSIRRCRARLSALKFGAGLYLVQIEFCLGWVYHHSVHNRTLFQWLFFGTLPIDVVWVVTAVFFGCVIWYRKKKRGDLAWLMKLRDEARS
jgi:hypothetical protein